MAPNQVSYLKGSSMESFPFGPIPKIDFRSEQQQHTLQWLQRDLLSTITSQFNSLSTKEFNTEFLQFSSLGTSIYKLQVQMSVWHEKPRHHPDGRQKGVRTDNYAIGFQKFRWNSFLIWAVSRRWCPVVRTVALQLHAISILRLPASGLREWSSGRLIRCTQFPYQ